MKTRNLIVVLIIGVFGLIISACSLTKSCYDLTQEYRDSISQLGDRWDSANSLANSTPRMQLASVIANLQNIRNDANTLTVPECAQEAQDNLIKYMDASIDGYISFLSDEGDYVVKQNFTRASQYFDTWKEKMAEFSIAPTK